MASSTDIVLDFVNEANTQLLDTISSTLTRFKRLVSEHIPLNGMKPAEHASALLAFIKTMSEGEEGPIFIDVPFFKEHDVYYEGCFIALLAHNKEIAIAFYDGIEDGLYCHYILTRLVDMRRWDIIVAVNGGVEDYSLAKQHIDTHLEDMVAHISVENMRLYCGDNADLIERLEQATNPLVKSAAKTS